MKILIIKLSALGDIYMSSVLLSAIKNHLPNAHVSWIVDSRFYSALAGHPAIDQITRLNRKQGSRMNRLASHWQLFKQLRRQQFDLVIDAQGLLKSGIWAQIAKAPRKIGLNNKEGSQYFFKERLLTANDAPEMCSEYLALIRHLKWHEPTPEMLVHGASQDISHLLNGKAKNSYITICPFTTRPQKHWLNTSWVQLVQQLQQQYHMPVVMLGGPQDKQAAATMDENGLMTNLVGKTTIQEAVAIIANTALLIGVDTGLTHVGTACRVPTIGLFTSTKPYTMTMSEKTRVLTSKLSCAPCRRSPTCDNRFDCQQELTANQVVREARSLLNAS